MRQRLGDQQPPVPNDRPHIHDLVAEDLIGLGTSSAERMATALLQRKQVGIARYGTPLQAGNGRDAVRDAIEEVLDLPVYLRQAIEEGRTDLVLLYQEALLLACRLDEANRRAATP